MAYETLTPARFKELKPQFSEVSDQTVQSYIDLATLLVDKSWPEKAFEPAWVAFTCHLMTIDGLGIDEASKSFSAGTAQYQSIKSGEVTLTRYQKRASESSYTDWLNSTPCGQFFFMLLKMAKSGPLVISVGSRCKSGYAKDHCGPVYGWPGVFYGSA